MVELTAPAVLADPVSDEKFIVATALAFEPQKDQIYMTDSKGHTQRLIFTGLVLSDKEQEEWDKFLAHCLAN